MLLERVGVGGGGGGGGVLLSAHSVWDNIMHMWYFWHLRPEKAQKSLRRSAVLSEPCFLHTKSKTQI